MSAEQLADIVSETLRIVLIVYLTIGIVLASCAAWRESRHIRLDSEDAAMLVGAVFIWLPIVVGEVREWFRQRKRRLLYAEVERRKELFNLNRDYLNIIVNNNSSLKEVRKGEDDLQRSAIAYARALTFAGQPVPEEVRRWVEGEEK